MHLNNDTPGTDNGRATRDQAFAPGIVIGATVTAGQVIGYVGDSGNAEGKSFALCTAKSTSPLTNAISSSLTNKPLSPIFDSATSGMRSPVVEMTLTRTSRPGCA